MSSKKFIFTSESVGYGHPDKLCDKISDAILDAHLEIDPDCKVAIETMISPNLVVIAGEVSSSLLQKESKVCCKSVGSFNSGDPKKNIERALEKTIEKEVEINNIATEDEIICNRPTVNYESIARSVLRDCGYTGVNGIDPDLCTVIVNVNQQSDDINRAVLQGGAGDQGMMFGYATNETEERMPLGLMLAHRLVMEVGNRRNIKNNSDKIENNGELIKNKGDKIENNGDVINYKGDKVENISIEDKTIGTDDLSISLGPDCKSQVSIEYLNNSGEMIPLRVDAIVMSVQHDKDVSVEQVREELKKVVSKVVPKKLLDNTKLYLQPTSFTIGGPAADTGLTGRKIIVDTYGGFGCHGGGAFSGKDASKVDRSGAYMARYIAKSLVDSNICKRALVQLSYAIGIDHPISINVDTYNTSALEPDEIIEIIKNNFDLSPNGIIRDLELKKPIYSKTAVYGHFGRKGFTWEKSKNLKF